MMIRCFFKQMNQKSIDRQVIVIFNRWYGNPVSISQRNLDFDVHDDIFLKEDLPKLEKEKSEVHNKKTATDKLYKHFELKKSDALEFLQRNEHTWGVRLSTVSKNIDTLGKAGVQLSTVLENPWLLGFTAKLLKERLELIKVLNPRVIDDFVPLTLLESGDLVEVFKQKTVDLKKYPKGDRIYYISKLTKVEPIVVSKAFLKRPSLFFDDIDYFVNVLQTISMYNIDAMSFLTVKNLNTFHIKKIHQRVKACHDMGRKNIRPWVLFDSYAIMRKSVLAAAKIAEERKEHSATDIISERLEFPPELLEDAIKKCRLETIHPKLITEKLDYLLNEANISKQQIVCCLHVLAFKLTVIKERITELRSLNHPLSSLRTVVLSKKVYEKFVANLRDKSSTNKL